MKGLQLLSQSQCRGVDRRLWPILSLLNGKYLTDQTSRDGSHLSLLSRAPALVTAPVTVRPGLLMRLSTLYTPLDKVVMRVTWDSLHSTHHWTRSFPMWVTPSLQCIIYPRAVREEANNISEKKVDLNILKKLKYFIELCHSLTTFKIHETIMTFAAGDGSRSW